MINKIVQKKIARTNISKSITRKLSIQFSLDGFSFCIKNQEEQALILATVSFENTLSPEQVLQELKQTFESEADLQVDFEHIEVIHQNNLNTLVPNAYFSEQHLEDYLKHTVKKIATDLVVFDSIDQLEAKNVYIPYVNINNYLFQHFGAFEYKHHTSVLIEKLLRIKKESQEVFVHMGKQSFDLLVFDKNQMRLVNTFEYETKEDVCYYILFTLEQLQLNPIETDVILLGATSPKSEIYRALYTYIKNVEFLFPQGLATDQTEIHPNDHFILLA